MNVAAAHHLRFGKDVISTFGPLASAYTHLYNPETDTLMFVASFVVALTLVAGLILIARATKLPWRVLLLLIVNQLVLRGSLFLIIPFLLVSACQDSSKHSRLGLVIVTLSATASAVLPLIRGSTTLLVAARGSAIDAVVMHLSASATAAMQRLALPTYYGTADKLAFCCLPPPEAQGKLQPAVDRPPGVARRELSDEIRVARLFMRMGLARDVDRNFHFSLCA